MEQDENHLDLLAVFHYVVAGLTALLSLFPLIHVAIGLFLAVAADDFFGWFFIVIGSMFCVLGMTLAACIFMAGKCLSRRTRYWFAFIVACVQCLFMPFGTVLGVFTIVVLSRPSVKRRFGLLLPATPAAPI